MDIDLNQQKVSNKIDPYNLKVLVKILNDEQEKKPVEKQQSSADDDWRHEPYLNSEKQVMIISSYGDETFPGAVVVEKTQDNSISDRGKLELVRQELDTLQDLYWKGKAYSLVYECTDFPGAQFSKQYYIDRIKQFFSLCNQGAVLFYTGHGEKETGNWCFKDGVITFEEIFGLYFDVMRGKLLYIISDCSSAGKWAEYCAAKLDEIGILSCGHHTRKEGILLKVFTSCGKSQQAIMGGYVKKMASINENEDTYVYYPGGSIECHQVASCTADIIKIRCNRKHGEQCQVVSADNTWMDRLVHSKLVHCVRGKDRGKPAWHYVLVDEEKEAAFKESFRSSGTVDVAEYGKVLKSGWGEDPPESVKNMLDRRFGKYLPRPQED